MAINKQQQIGEVVATNIKLAEVFGRFGIDFCCGGKQTIEEACVKKELQTMEVLEALNKVINANDALECDFKVMPLDELVEYIEKNHHEYIREKAAVLIGYLDKLESVHGHRHPELSEVRRIFKESMSDLAMHLRKEELVLFPYIKRLAMDEVLHTKIISGILTPINQMNDEHLQEGERWEEMSRLTNKYSVPADGCNTYRLAYQMLDEFVQNLHVHIHLENNVLFPRAIALEAEKRK